MPAPKAHRDGEKQIRYLLQNIIACADCERLLRAQYNHDIAKYLESKSVSTSCPLTSSETKRTFSVRSDIVERQVAAIVEKVSFPENWTNDVKNKVVAKDGRKDLEDQLKKAKTEYDRRKKVFIATGIVDDEITVVDMKIKNLEQELNIMPANQTENKAILTQLHDAYPVASKSQQMEILHILFYRFFYDFIKQHIVSFIPYPDFIPLFTEIADKNHWKIDGEKFLIY